MKYEWDVVKAISNLRKHGVSFEEACEVFSDPLSITIGDPLYEEPGATREVLVGCTGKLRLLIVVFIEKEDNMRIISARIATLFERKLYEEI